MGDMEFNKSRASLSFDLDNKWSYLKTHGHPEWEAFPSYLDVLVPRVLNLLKERHLTVTFFIVGQDAALHENQDILRSIANAGHEIGNHSFHHEPWLHLYNEAAIEDDITIAEEHIERATGERPIGFRAPGYSLTHTVLGILARHGYRYDASTLPSLLAPLARAYYFATTSLSQEQRRQRKVLGGTLRDGLRPIKPYRWRTDNGMLIEIPVTTMPLVKVPMHVSYLMGLRVISRGFALQYFHTALRLCRWTGIQPSIVLHPTDFLGCDDTRDLDFIPGMSLPWKPKIEFVSNVLQCLSANYAVVTLRQHACEAARVSNLPVVEPNFKQVS